MCVRVLCTHIICMMYMYIYYVHCLLSISLISTQEPLLLLMNPKYQQQFMTHNRHSGFSE